MPTWPARGTQPWDPDLKTYIDGTLGNLAAPVSVASGTGIDPTGATDSSAALQALLDAMPATGGRLHFPAPPAGGYYKIATGLTTSCPNLEITGEGGHGHNITVGPGATRLHYTGTGWAFTYNPAGSSTVFRGPEFSNLHVTGTSSGTGGIRIKRTNNIVFRDVAVSDFSAGTAIQLDGTGDICQYARIDQPLVSGVKVGLDLIACNGIQIYGGMIEGIHGSLAAGSIGIKTSGGGDTLRLFGTDVQSFERLVDLTSTPGRGNELHGLRGEDWSTSASAVRIASTGTAMFGGTLNNTLNGATGVALETTATAADAFLRPGSITTGTSTMPVTDAGTNTDLRFPGQTRFQRKARGGTNLTIASTQTSFAAFDSGSAALFDLVFTGVVPGDWLEIGCSFQVSNEAVQLQVDAQTMVTLGTAVNSVGQQDGVTPLPSAGVMAWLAQPSVTTNVGGSVFYQVVAADIATNGTCTVRPVCRVASATARTIFSGGANPILWFGRNHGKM